ncbi:MAG: RdgB/HAM1 family non-canonical purine NTP pyrophosphatase [Fibrobacteraceae bacterium]|nr:RdgB/HAM1 family non-canonical purine NTP pyrophosphatase [Fibrobacteraceae bacterium]
MKFVIATGNAGKLKEFRAIFNNPQIEFLTLKDIGFTDDIVEDGNTFAENATIKAKTVARFVRTKGFCEDTYVLADDSGLEVFALNGEPGIYSARYVGYHGNDDGNNIKVLQRLEETGNTEMEKRGARFFCALAMIKASDKTEKTEIFEGEVRGHIDYKCHGTHGFGYDAIFIPQGYDTTFGELSATIKDGMSHRGNAIRLLVKFLGM